MSSKSLSPQAYAWLSRSTFGVNDGLAQRFLSLPGTDQERWAAFIKEQLNPANYLDAETETKIQKLSLETLKKPLPDLWLNHFVASRKMNQGMVQNPAEPLTAKQEKKNRKARREIALEPTFDLEMASWMRIVHSSLQVNERMVEFWHDHFNIHGYEARVAPALLVLNRDVIRPHALGNFRQLLGEVCKNPAMLVYLDNAFNQSGNPNENFARELFELHTLGAENYLGTADRDSVKKDVQNRPVGYVDGDVYEAARAFTGWRVEDGTYGLTASTGQFLYSETWHDRFQKVILGEKFPEHLPPLKDGEKVLDLLCSHPGTARHIVRKLCRRFISDKPSDSYVTQLANVFLQRKDSPTQIKDTLQDIFTSAEFYSEKSFKFKRPVEYFASLIRILNVPFEPSERFINSVSRCGQRLFGWKTPDGPPDISAPWQSPQSLIERWKIAQQILLAQMPGCEFEVWPSKEPVTPTELVEALGQKILGPRFSNSLREHLLSRASGGRRIDATLPEAFVRERALQVVELIVMSPEFQLR